jgi:hypothetical protein
MKTSLLFILLTVGAAAQSYTFSSKTYSNGEHAPMNGNPGDLFMTTLTFSNSSGAPIQVFVDRYQKNIAPYWAVCYCYIMCHSPADDTVTVEIPSNSTTEVTLQFKTDSVNRGLSSASFRMYQIGFAAITQTVNMLASTMGPVAVAEIAKADEMKLFPNPATQTIRIQSNSKITSSKVSDVSGAIRLAAFQDSESLEIDVSDLAPGIYFIETESSGIITRQKFVRQ